MGVFDDAIRQHLDLKRQTGADESELKELEDEAFGQAARPGDPDFPGSTSEEAAVGEEKGAETDAPAEEAPAEAPTAGVALVEAPPDAPPAADLPETDSHEESPLVPFDQPGEPKAEAAPESETESADVEVPAAEEPDGAEPDSEPVEAESAFSTSEREAIADQPTVFFDQAPADLELGDLELDFDEEIEEVGGSLSEPLPDEPLAVEEVFEEPAADVAEPPHEVEPEPDSPEPDTSDQLQPDTAEAEAAPAEPGTGEDDVLEETPEFLRENPDDDELWFEQGEPKDFDF